MGVEDFTYTERSDPHLDVEVEDMRNGRLLVDRNFIVGVSTDPKKGNRADLYITTGLPIVTHKGVGENMGVISTKPVRLSINNSLARVGKYRIIFFGRVGYGARLRIFSDQDMDTAMVPPQEDFNRFLADLQLAA